MALVASAAYGVYSADKAADAQVDAANAANDTQWRMYKQTRKDNQPWMQAGQGGLSALMELYGMQDDGNGGYTRNANPEAAMNWLKMDPSYQFRLQQGQGALENSAAARGGMLSGNALRALSDYGQNTASMEFGNIANRLSGLAGVGQSAGQYLGGLGQNTANAVGGNLLNAGQARASGYMGQYGAVNNMVNQGIKIGGMAVGAMTGGMGGGGG